MYGNKLNGSITFYYDSEDLFKEVGILSAYMAKNFKDESGSMLDELSISDDERDIYNVCLKQALPNIYDEMVKMTSCVVDAFDDDAIVEADETDGLKRKKGTYVEFTLRNNNAFNGNVLTLVDSTLLNCIKFAVLAEFYSVCLHTDLYRISRDKFVTNVMQLRQRMFPLKKKVVSSQI